MMISNITLRERNDFLAALWGGLSVVFYGVRGGVAGLVGRGQAVDDYGVAFSCVVCFYGVSFFCLCYNEKYRLQGR